jgi:uncharacterized cupredoxin-like copper-binding protein
VIKCRPMWPIPSLIANPSLEDLDVSPIRRHGLAALAGVAAVASLLVMGACSRAASPDQGTRVQVTARDFKFELARSNAPAGGVVFDIDNEGPSTHELVVVGTNLPPDGLPLRPDGLTVEEDSPLLQSIGENGDIGLGDRRTLTLQLSPGRYVLFCNLEGHYLGGMRLGFEVGADAAAG